ncbi:flagellar biosynthesis protein FlgB [Roseomonas sp. SSH11]|uniref:Flagellar biosynthesis protein FlgB n=1 Tax=Pararoseomonas baculiformis TaxID=2820812 RepID=A0ABS4AGV8_9PROT|nr:flagellar biosynthesis protein FlgB [Pararoseomonas baculiformis]MBP0446236.1 flagellar biosynthesis protein FlgB [Pararoseomonas baculiformis]
MNSSGATARNPIELAEARLRWLDRRQEVLARNIAQADTPGYRTRDIAPFAQHLRQAGGAQSLARTDPAHRAGTGRAAGTVAAPAGEISPDGNTVSLDEQAIKVAETDSAHALAMGLHRRWLALYRTALGRNG